MRIIYIMLNKTLRHTVIHTKNWDNVALKVNAQLSWLELLKAGDALLAKVFIHHPKAIAGMDLQDRYISESFKTIFVICQ